MSLAHSDSERDDREVTVAAGANFKVQDQATGMVSL